MPINGSDERCSCATAGDAKDAAGPRISTFTTYKGEATPVPTRNRISSHFATVVIRKCMADDVSTESQDQRLRKAIQCPHRSVPSGDVAARHVECAGDKAGQATCRTHRPTVQSATTVASSSSSVSHVSHLPNLRTAQPSREYASFRWRAHRLRTKCLPRHSPKNQPRRRLQMAREACVLPGWTALLTFSCS
jgi:hypothetical protein